MLSSVDDTSLSLVWRCRGRRWRSGGLRRRLFWRRCHGCGLLIGGRHAILRIALAVRLQSAWPAQSLIDPVYISISAKQLPCGLAISHRLRQLSGVQTTHAVAVTPCGAARSAPSDDRHAQRRRSHARLREGGGQCRGEYAGGCFDGLMFRRLRIKADRLRVSGIRCGIVGVARPTRSARPACR